MTLEEIDNQITDINIEIDRAERRVKYLRDKRRDMVLKAHGIVLGKTIVRATAAARPSHAHKTFLVTGVEDYHLRTDFRPWVIGVLTTRYGAGRSAKSVCLKSAWDFITDEDGEYV